jgi:hypothetical protein
MRTSLMVGTVLICHVAVAAPPSSVRTELAHVATPPVITRVAALPPPLRRSLARAFRAPRLELASVGERVRETDFHIVGDPESDADARAPYRRLIFAFETSRHYVVYYEHRAPIAGTALAFTKDRVPKFVWGGVDFDEPWAKSPRALARRILRNRLIDDKPFYW